jgi:hypothetical protein
MLNALIFGAGRELESQVQQMCKLTQDICVYRSLEHRSRATKTKRGLNSFAPHLQSGTWKSGLAVSLSCSARRFFKRWKTSGKRAAPVLCLPAR